MAGRGVNSEKIKIQNLKLLYPKFKIFEGNKLKGTGKQKASLKKKRIGVLMGGISPEREISLKTGEAVFNALKALGYKAIKIDAGEDILKRISGLKIDIAFIALHGGWGEDGGIQGALNIMEIPYTGSGVCASAVAMDKILSKKIFLYHNLPTPGFWVYEGDESGIKTFLKKQSFKLPVVVKPVVGGSTIGVYIVFSRKDLRKAISQVLPLDRRVIIEEYIAGRDLTVGVLNGKPLPIVEMVPKSGFYDYKAKYTKGETEYVCPARIPAKTAKKIHEIAMQAYWALGCKGAPRIDFRLSPDNKPYLLEVNTIPGMTGTSLLPMAASMVGINFNSLVEMILEESFNERL